eukprot:scaffold27578_cov33-Cyclotella_meneghiniana.AAC.3
MARVVAGATITSRGAASRGARVLGVLAVVVIDVMGSVLVGGLFGITVATRTLAVVSPTIVVASTATIASTLHGRHGSHHGGRCDASCRTWWSAADVASCGSPVP